MPTRQDTSGTAIPRPLLEIREFIKLPIEERRRILAEQAEALIAEYELESNRRERELWQGGDIVEY